MGPAKSGEHDETIVARASADGRQWTGIDPFGNRIEVVEVDPS